MAYRRRVRRSRFNGKCVDIGTGLLRTKVNNSETGASGKAANSRPSELGLV